MRRLGSFQHSDNGIVRPQLLIVLLAMLLVALPDFSAAPGRLLGYGQDVVQPARELRLPPHIDHDQLMVGALASAQTGPGSIDCQQVSCLALTFDDGPNPETTPQVISELEQAQIHATFFLVGSRIAGNEDLLRRMYADGDQIGNHSWTHPDMATLSADQVQQQIQLTQAAIVNAGVPPPTVFRPPYGDVNQTMENTVHLSILMWNEDPKDWAASTPQQVTQAVEASAQPGGIIDMHDIYHVTADALPQILTNLTARGYHFVTVNQLLKLTPSSRGLYYGYAPR
jgi:peptidoglycan/xylan/chitin deacetylase (PgdA/CDA1 family)